MQKLTNGLVIVMVAVLGFAVCVVLGGCIYNSILSLVA